MYLTFAFLHLILQLQLDLVTLVILFDLAKQHLVLFVQLLNSRVSLIEPRSCFDHTSTIANHRNHCSELIDQQLKLYNELVICRYWSCLLHQGSISGFIF